MRVEKLVLNEERNVTLTAYLQEVGGEFRYVTRRPAILVLPGGGYQMCSDREADPVAMPYLKAGYQVFILRYSIKADALWPNPLNDYEQAMELIQSKAKDWSLYPDKVAIIGFSAGGHLAACAATMAKNRPAAAILGYAVAGEDVKGCNTSAPSAIEAVDQDTCPCFLFATRTDNVVPIANTVDFMQALTKYDISFESHIYAYGPHGFSTCDTSVQYKDTEICVRVPDWVEDSIGWLKDVLGEFGMDGMTEPVCKAHVTSDHEAFMSVDCTIGRLMGNPEAKAVLMPILERGTSMGAGQDQEGFTSGNMFEMVKKMKLRDALSYGNVPEDVMNRLNEQLGKIPNI